MFCSVMFCWGNINLGTQRAHIVNIKQVDKYLTVYMYTFQPYPMGAGVVKLETGPNGIHVSRNSRSGGQSARAAHCEGCAVRLPVKKVTGKVLFFILEVLKLSKIFICSGKYH